MKNAITSIFAVTVLFSSFFAQENDPYLWLEEVDGVKAHEWINNQNKATFDQLSNEKEYKSIYSKTLEILNSTDRIVSPIIIGNYIYNYWTDKDHIRGIWRRTPKDLFMQGSPNWEVLLDLDLLSKNENIDWVFAGFDGLYPNYNRFIIQLSKGGGDAVEVREFDVTKKQFIKDGFTLKESKSDIGYLDENTLIVSTDFGEGTMTTSGYPNQVKLWRRGTLLKDAQFIYEGNLNDVNTSGYTLRDGGKNYFLIDQKTTFYTSKTFLWQNNKLISIDIPDDAQIATLHNDQLILTLKSDWKIEEQTFKQGAIVSLNFTKLINGKKEIQLVYMPDEHSSISGITSTKNKLLITILNNVKSELYIYNFTSAKWSSVKVNAPDYGTISIGSTDDLSDNYFFYYQNFVTPTTLYFADAESGIIKSIKSLPAFFDGSKYKVEQFKAKSKDGTLIPYFVVSSKSIELNSKNPTLLYAYGGFEISLEPHYAASIGSAWLDKGGVYVLANIRGGGEFGPKWHQAGLKENRQNVFDDFYAISEDLIARKITCQKNLGIMGGSNGGLLMGVALTQRPDLYNAVVCQVPLLDMKRFNKLLAGASWMGEYGNPDISEEWAYIQKYSPYHNLKNGVKYPEVFFTTSTRDDRVHPAHARKMAAKMSEMGYKIFYYESTEGGHAGATTNEQKAKLVTMEYVYLWMKLKNL